MGDTLKSNAPACVTLSALEGGHLTLPEKLFITDADPEKRATVPSLCFLIQHKSISSDGKLKQTNLIFDLGLKRDLNGYPPKQQDHIAARQPVISHPDCADSLRYGTAYAERLRVGQIQDVSPILIDPAKDIHAVILSHVHWDHVGTPSDFESASFVVGAGTLDLLRNGAGPLYPADIFNDEELPVERTVEFPPVTRDAKDDTSIYENGPHVPKNTIAPEGALTKLASNLPPHVLDNWSWQQLASFPHTLDFFGDGSVYVIDSPGHLYGHVNLLVRVVERKYVYLGGDCCHDPRILSGERGIALYEDGWGGLRSVHVHTGVARRTLDQIEAFVKGSRVEGDNAGVEVEVVVAHDGVWREKNHDRFWPGSF
ncbi:hypothetical protein SEUCBS139899_005560 [Sporothrix eucalyptigena]|uniref:Metallo-beta-lactamase domain-containing protein n=1 Tax=Sporothrix eucalyptigena TaxID=1812306 RepID=A0ABP0C0Q8_9PEZI